MIKDPQWYAVQEGDATMMTIVSLPGQKNLIHVLFIVPYSLRPYLFHWQPGWQTW